MANSPVLGPIQAQISKIMAHTPGRPRKKVVTTDELLDDLEDLLNKLAASVSDSSFEDQFTPQQMKIIVDHLAYSLIAGFEQSTKKKLMEEPRNKIEEVRISSKTMNRASLAGALGFDFKMINGGLCQLYNRAKPHRVYQVIRKDLFTFLRIHFKNKYEFIITE
jgi:hypothetical protein